MATSSSSYLSKFDTFIHPYVGALAGLGLAYAYAGGVLDPIVLGVGAVGGYFALPILQAKVSGLSAPYSQYYVPAAIGGSAAYLYSGPDPMVVAIGAAGGVGASYVLSQ